VNNPLRKIYGTKPQGESLLNCWS